VYKFTGLEIEKSALRANVHDKKEARHPPKSILPAVVFLDAADLFPFTEFFNFWSSCHSLIFNL
jgi:hypothetical protein